MASLDHRSLNLDDVVSYPVNSHQNLRAIEHFRGPDRGIGQVSVSVCVVTRVRVCVCVYVCMSLTALPHYCTDPGVGWAMVGVPPSCALLGEFAIGAWVSLS